MPEVTGIVPETTEIVPVTSDAFPLPAPRSPSEALEDYRLKLLGLDRMSPWKAALAAYVRELEAVGVLRDARLVRE